MDKSTAMNLLKNTYVKYTLIDGTTVELTLAFFLLKVLESKKPEIVDRYYKIMSKQQKDMRESDIITVIYTAYCCANVFSDEELFDEDTFTILMGSDRVSLRGITNRLVGAKKKPDFEKHS